jgi:hypothetical protein
MCLQCFMWTSFPFHLTLACGKQPEPQVLACAQERLRKGVEALSTREAELEAIKSARYELETVSVWFSHSSAAASRHRKIKRCLPSQVGCKSKDGPLASFTREASLLLSSGMANQLSPACRCGWRWSASASGSASSCS